LGERAGDHLEHIAGAELDRRQVHREADVMRPLHGIAASALQDPPVDRRDHAALFRHRDEAIRRDDALLGMPPADQRFDRAGLAVARIDQGLVVGFELAVGGRVLQADFQRAPQPRLLIHRELEQPKGIAAVRLGDRAPDPRS
jgi:hypothetical protein